MIELYDKMMVFENDITGILDIIKNNFVGDYDFVVFNEFAFPTKKLARKEIHPEPFQSLNQKMIDMLDSNYKIFSKKYNTFKNFDEDRNIIYRRMPDTFYVENHSDGPGMYTHLLYLNDDYNGGEVYFTDLNIKFKPKAGQSLCFFSEYMHEVLPVSGGYKYTVHMAYKQLENK